MTRTNDVFISYKREERDKAFIIAEALTERGYKVWWDIELLPGSSFVSEISAIIEKSKVVIVLWSKASVESDFVLGEAELARKKGTIVPARLDDCEIPLQFSSYHTLDLSAWTGSADRSQLEPLLKAVAEKVAPSAEVPKNIEATTTALHSPEIEALFWREIASAERQSKKEYQIYLQRFGDEGIFSDLARIRIDQLVLEERSSTRFSLSKGAKVATVVVALVAGVFGVILKGNEVLEIIVPLAPLEEKIVFECKPLQNSIMTVRFDGPNNIKDDALNAKLTTPERARFHREMKKLVSRIVDADDFAKQVAHVGDIYIGTDGTYRRTRSGTFVRGKSITKEERGRQRERWKRENIPIQSVMFLDFDENAANFPNLSKNIQSIRASSVNYIDLSIRLAKTIKFDILTVDGWQLYIFQTIVAHQCSRY